MADKNLKPGWKVWRFDQIATNVNVRIDDPSKSGMDHYVGLEHLDPDSLRIRRWGSPSDVEAGKLCFKTGDIIFAKRRAYQRKLGVAEFEGICSAHAMVLRAKPEVVLPEFLPFFMQSDVFMNRAVEISVGSLSPTINWKTMAVQEFALPPIHRQRQMSELLAAIDKASEEYRSSSECLKNVRFASMASLSNERNGVPLRKLADVCTLISDGTHKTPTYLNEGIPFLRVTDIQSTQVDWREVKRISLTEHEYLKRRVAPIRGDVLLSKNGTIGIPRLVDWDEDFSIFVSLCLLRPSHCLRSEYLAEVLLSPSVRAQFRKRSKQGTVTNLHLEEIRDCLIPAPSLEKQDALISEFSSFKDIENGCISRIRSLATMKSLILNPVEEKADVH